MSADPIEIPAGLAAGYRRFRRERYAAEAERYRALASGQRPRTMVIACADSRADPAMIFSAAPGELFVVRNVAALVPPFEEVGGHHGTSAAIEFAVTELAVPDIVVMGHGLCGGIAAALAERPKGRFIGPWVELLAGVRDELLQTAQDLDVTARYKLFEQMAVLYSLQNLTSFPFVAAAIEAGRLRLHGAWFAIAEGELEWLEGRGGRFQPVASLPAWAGP
jgi:carbonic anhydrase